MPLANIRYSVLKQSFIIQKELNVLTVACYECGYNLMPIRKIGKKGGGV
jgi:hypothetical protein